MSEQTNESRRRRRMTAAIITGVAMFGVVGASAASLGGVTSNSLGADVGVVASCDTNGVTLGYTNGYDAASGAYRTTGVSVSAIDAACNGLTINVTLKNTAGASIGTGSATVAAGAATIALSTPAPAAQVTGAAVVIAG